MSASPKGHPLSELPWATLLNGLTEMRRELQLASPSSLHDEGIEQQLASFKRALRETGFGPEALEMAESLLQTRQSQGGARNAAAAATRLVTPIVLRLPTCLWHQQGVANSSVRTQYFDDMRRPAEAPFLRIGPRGAERPLYLDVCTVPLPCDSDALPEGTELICVCACDDSRHRLRPVSTWSAGDGCTEPTHAPCCLCYRPGSAAAADATVAASTAAAAAAAAAVAARQALDRLPCKPEGGGVCLTSGTVDLHKEQPSKLAEGVAVHVLRTVRGAHGAVVFVKAATPFDGSVQISGDAVRLLSPPAGKLRIEQGKCAVLLLEYRRAGRAVLQLERADGGVCCGVLLDAVYREPLSPLNAQVADALITLSVEHSLPLPGSLTLLHPEAEGAQARRELVRTTNDEPHSSKDTQSFGEVSCASGSLFPEARKCHQCGVGAPKGCVLGRCRGHCASLLCAGGVCPTHWPKGVPPAEALKAVADSADSAEAEETASAAATAGGAAPPPKGKGRQGKGAAPASAAAAPSRRRAASSSGNGGEGEGKRQCTGDEEWVPGERGGRGGAKPVAPPKPPKPPTEAASSAGPATAATADVAAARQHALPSPPPLDASFVETVVWYRFDECGWQQGVVDQELSPGEEEDDDGKPCNFLICYEADNTEVGTCVNPAKYNVRANAPAGSWFVVPSAA